MVLLHCLGKFGIPMPTDCKSPKLPGEKLVK